MCLPKNTPRDLQRVVQLECFGTLPRRSYRSPSRRASARVRVQPAFDHDQHLCTPHAQLDRLQFFVAPLAFAPSSASVAFQLWPPGLVPCPRVLLCAPSRLPVVAASSWTELLQADLGGERD